MVKQFIFVLILGFITWTYGQVDSNFTYHTTDANNLLKKVDSLDYNIDAINAAITKARDSMIVLDASNIINSTGGVSKGLYNAITNDTARVTGLKTGAAFGTYIRLYSWDNFYGGTAGIVDGKISAGTGNSNVASANDSWVSGNQNVAGRRLYPITSQGTDELHGLGIGTRAYVIVSPSEGDITGFFPNPTFDDSTTYLTNTYGSGAVSSNGNIYPSGYTPITDQTWALHPYCIIKGTAESALSLMKILKCTYSSATGTKIWYDSTASAYSTITYVMSSYSPAATLNGAPGGNGQNVGGIKNSTWGYGANAEGRYTRAWNTATHSEGESTAALAGYSHAQNYGTIAEGLYSSSNGRQSRTRMSSQISNAVGKFDNVGDAQHSTKVAKVSKTGAGWHEFPIFDYSSSTSWVGFEPNKTYAGTITLVGRQTSTSPGKAGESCAYEFKFILDVRGEYPITAIDVDTEVLTIGTHSLPVNSRVSVTTTGTVFGGGALTSLYYVVNPTATEVQLSTTPGGAAINITSAGTGTNTLLEIDTLISTRTLIGRNFVDDGDIVGDGLSTGIRADVQTQYFIGRNPVIRIDGLASRTIRWVANTSWVEVGN